MKGTVYSIKLNLPLGKTLLVEKHFNDLTTEMGRLAQSLSKLRKKKKPVQQMLK